MAFSLLRISVRASPRLVDNGLCAVGINCFDPRGPKVLHSQQSLQRVLDKSLCRTFFKAVEGSSQTQRNYESDSDSDSDDERKEKGNSDFWRRKIRSFHGVIDVNKDGVVSYDDFKILADRFIKLGHLDNRQKKDFLDALRHVWEEQWGIVDKYNMVTTQQYLENMHHVLNDKSLKKKATKFLPYLFKAVDHDRSGTISISEFKLFFECLGLNADDATHSFDAIDKNGDGIISMKEFIKNGRDYFMTEDETKPSKIFWGPLAS